MKNLAEDMREIAVEAELVINKKLESAVAVLWDCWKVKVLQEAKLGRYNLTLDNVKLEPNEKEILFEKIRNDGFQVEELVSNSIKIHWK